MAGGIAFAAVTALSLFLWPRDQGASVRLVPQDTAVVAQGARLYATHCAACHGAELEGEPDWRVRRPDGTLPAPPHDETGHTWHHPDWQLFQLTKHGLPVEIGGEPYRSTMPAYAHVLSDAEVIAVLSFIKSRWPADVRARHDALNKRSPRPAAR